eukprot:TRINITY_DN804_c0_g1_i5.p1 TRINITY_DN804_c0_g1~~TRINITY_DN804_c0_g1_i5.p1  ORF type:complete len:885 (+),score=294.18 TRINITY_DN804_c0_g1_i5:94-2748(+)
MRGAVLLAAGVSGAYPDSLKQLKFLNSGTVRSNQTFALGNTPSIYNEGYTYFGTGNPGFHGESPGLEYLFDTTDPKTPQKTPPSGMRSSLPLGGLGEGTFELRADGRFSDWRDIFNNAPYSPTKQLGTKIDIDDAAIGVHAGGAATLLRTHPGHAGLPAADALTYSAAFPVARLSAESQALASAGVAATVHAFCEWEPHAPWNSAVPAVFIAVTLKNSKQAAVPASVLLTMPNDVTNGTFSKAANALTMKTPAGAIQQLEGNLSFSYLQCDGCAGDASVTATAAAGLPDVWSAFTAGAGSLPGISAQGRQGALAASATVPAGGEATLTFALTWFFPNRLWGSELLGHYYSNNFTSSEDVAAKRGTAANLDAVVSKAAAWHSLCFNSSMPATLQDSLVNTPPVWGKTSFWTRDGRWRNFESHSCTQMEPPHIHFYRALGYQLFEPSIERQTPEMYASTVASQGGVVNELFGCGCGGCVGGGYNLDQPMGGPRGDDNPAFLLDVYMNWKWGAGDAWLKGMWPAVKSATDYVLSKAPAPFNLTYQMVNTNDEHGVIGDVNTYNSFIYLSSLSAVARMAAKAADATLAGKCTDAVARGRSALGHYLWNSEGFWAQAYCQNVPTTQNGYALQGGGLYGQLWGQVLGLADDVGVSKGDLASHLSHERARNKSPLGLYFATNRTVEYYHGCPKSGSPVVGTGFIDQDVWNSHSMTHAAMSIYSGYGSAADAMGVAALVTDAYRTVMADQWDYRDTTTTYNAQGGWDPKGLPRPSVNSHYARQTIWWAIPLALSGQQYDAPAGTLSFAPTGEAAPSATAAGGPFAVLLPHASATATLHSNPLCMHVAATSGTWDLTSLRISVAVPGVAKQTELTLKSGAAVLERGLEAVLCA